MSETESDQDLTLERYDVEDDLNVYRSPPQELVGVAALEPILQVDDRSQVSVLLSCNIYFSMLPVIYFNAKNKNCLGINVRAIYTVMPHYLFI